MSVTLKGIFNRVDANRDGALDRAEVKKFVEDAGVGSGLFAGKKVNGATDAFMDAFDPGKTGTVTWDQFAQRGAALIPGAAQNATPDQVRQAGDDLVARADGNRDGTLTRDEISGTVEKELDARNVSMSGTKADIAAKMAVHMLDGDGDGRVSRAEVRSLADDVAAQLARIRGGGR